MTTVSTFSLKGRAYENSDGTLALYNAGEIKFNQNNSAAVAGGTLRVADGSVALTSSDVFGNASGPADMTLELCSGRTLDLNGLRNPLPRRSLLRGATITTKQRTPENKRFEQFAYMKDYDLTAFSRFTWRGKRGQFRLFPLSTLPSGPANGWRHHLRRSAGRRSALEARLYNAHTKTVRSRFRQARNRCARTAQPCSAELHADP